MKDRDIWTKNFVKQREQLGKGARVKMERVDRGRPNDDDDGDGDG